VLQHDCPEINSDKFRVICEFFVAALGKRYRDCCYYWSQKNGFFWKSKQPPDSRDSYVSCYICVFSLSGRCRVAYGLQDNKGGEQLRISCVACDCGVDRSSSPSVEKIESRRIVFMEGGSILVGIRLGEDWLRVQFQRAGKLRFR